MSDDGWRPVGDVPEWVTALLRERGSFAKAEAIFDEYEQAMGVVFPYGEDKGDGFRYHQATFRHRPE